PLRRPQRRPAARRAGPRAPRRPHPRRRPRGDDDGAGRHRARRPGGGTPPRPGMSGADAAARRPRRPRQAPAGGIRLSAAGGGDSPARSRREQDSSPGGIQLSATGGLSATEGGGSPRVGTNLRPTSRGWATGITAAVLLALGWWAHYPGVTGLGLGLTALLACAVVGLLLPAPVSVRRTARPPRVARLDECTAS